MGAERIPVYPEGRTKACLGCQQIMPWDRFRPHNFHVGTDRVKGVRSLCRPCEAAEEERKRWSSGGNLRLPIGPWRAFLDSITPEYDSEEDLAAAMGVWAKRLYDWRNVNKSIPLDSADAALCNLDMPHMLRELWPELYDDALLAA